MSGSFPNPIWAQLSTPHSPANSIPFVGQDGATINTDVLNFYYLNSAASITGSQLNQSLFVYNGFQQSAQDKSATPGPVTINKTMGRVAIPAGGSSITITNNCCFSNSVILLSMESADAVLTRVRVVPGNGSFVISGNANASATVKLGFVIMNGVFV